MSASSRIYKSYRVKFYYSLNFYKIDIYRLELTWPEKSAYISGRHHWFPRE